METKKPQNPNAFPTPMETSYEYNLNGQTVGNQEGMTLRDYFANSAMQGLMSMENKGEYNTIDDAWSKISEYSYQIADAMLKQRELNDENL
jgi:hypothetical protein